MNNPSISHPSLPHSQSGKKWVHTPWHIPFLKVCAAIALPIAGPAAHAGTYALLAVWSLRGPIQAIEALSLAWVVSFLNPGIYNLTDASDFLRWLVIGFAFISVSARALKGKSTIPKTVICLLIYMIAVGTLAPLISYAPDVSLFKLFSFALGTITILMGFHLTRHEAPYWKVWFLMLFAVIVTLSFPFILSDVGYYRNMRGFQGILNHPQAYGTFLAPFLAWLTIAVCEIYQKKIWFLLLIFIAVISLFATQSRTGLLAAASSVLLTICWAKFKKPGTLGQWVTWTARLSPILIVGAIIFTLNAGSINEAVHRFILKGNIERDLSEGFYSSRGFLLENLFTGFLEHPLTGIGFGVASDSNNFNIRRDPLFGLPVGASVEKGFAIVAALEETGLIGFTLLLLLLGSLLRPVFRSKSNLPPIALAVGALLVNFGESVFFALGGSGLLVWLILGVARVFGQEIQR